MASDRQSDEIDQLLARIALQDAKALKSLYDLVGNQLLTVAWRVLQDRALAEDVLQEVFVSLWKQGARRLPGQVFTLAWLCVITRHRAIDVVRKKRADVPLQWEDQDGEEHFHDVQDEAASPLANLLAHQDGVQLGRCLERLEPQPRQALLLAFYDGLTHLEIAHHMTRPLGTIKAWTRRSLLRLKGCMEATG